MINRAWNTQIMQNYFDPTDVRSRANPVSLEAQLLNMPAVELDDLDLRTARELAQFLQTVPVNIDSRGVYYAGRVPDSLITSDNGQFHSVVGIIGSKNITLTKYDDRLQPPTRIEAGTPVAMSQPKIFELIGAGDDTTQTYAVQYAYPGTLNIPNKVQMWLDQTGSNFLAISVTITGETFPQPAWVAERRKSSEVVTINRQGYVESRNRWAVIDKVAVRNLPTGARLRGWNMPFGMPAAWDSRPFTTVDNRDVTFDRYWQISNSDASLKEMYMGPELSGLETSVSYLLPDAMIDVAVEPNTNGIVVVSDSTLYYGDRREVLPDVTKTGIQAEPLYGLEVYPDETVDSITKYVILSGTPYANSGRISQYRYTLNDQNCILPDGALGPINGGWREGAPVPVSFPLLSIGDYQFKLEMQDGDGVLTYDVRPYRNPAFTPLSQVDISNLVSSIQAIGYDSYGKLWIWDGYFAVPMIIHYDAYVFDSSNGYLYTTDNYDSIQII